MVEGAVGWEGGGRLGTLMMGDWDAWRLWGSCWDMVLMVSACGIGAVSSFKLLNIQVGGPVLDCELEYSAIFRLSQIYLLLDVRR